MAASGIVGTIIIILNFLVSYKGFKSSTFFENYKLEVDKVLINREFYRLISSGFLHVSWTHLIFNMVSLYAFSGLVEMYLGFSGLIVIYFASLVGGNLFALFIHKHHGDYSAVGASGAVVGIIFAAIALYPGLRVSLFIGPRVPSWLFGLLYVAFSIYGIKSKKDNIAHEAHLGGGIIGMISGLLLKPELIITNYIPILAVMIPSIAFIYVIIKRPEFLILENPFARKKENYFDIDHKYNDIQFQKQQELDKLLEKISQKGIEKLSKKEKNRLEELSK